VSTLVVAGKTPQRVAATAAVLADWMEGPGSDVEFDGRSSRR